MKNFMLMACLMLTILACNSDDEDPIVDNTNNAIMEVQKDGESFTITEFNNTLVSAEQYGEMGRRMDLRCTLDGGTFIITVSNWDWQNPPENGIKLKTYDTNFDTDSPESNTECMEESGIVSFCDGALGTYLVGQTTYISEGLDSEELGTINITANDPANKTVGGNFDFVIASFTTGEEITLTGTFSNLEYITQ